MPAARFQIAQWRIFNLLLHGIAVVRLQAMGAGKFDD
jgi:hypothetical protein